MAYNNNNSIKKLHEIWQTKEYRSIPVPVFDYLQQHLSLGAFACWITIHRLVYFEKDWQAPISRTQLAKRLQKCPDTMSKYLDELIRAKCLIKKEQFINGVWSAPILQITLPEAFITSLEKSPNRKSSLTLVAPTQTMSHAMEQNKSKVEKKNLFYVKHMDDNSLSMSENGSNAPALDSEIEVSQDLDGAYPNFSSPNSNNINNNKYINNNTVVVEKEKLEKQIQKAKKEHDKLLALCSKNLQKYYGDLKKARSTLSDLELKLSRLQTSKAPSMPKPQSKDYLRQEGPRAISSLDAERLEAFVNMLPVGVLKKRKLFNEIAYEIRFGSLQKSNQTGQELSVSHALNIAKKLVRKNLWMTPVALQA